MTGKKAYNNFSDYIPRPRPYDVKKWIAALRTIKTSTNAGQSYIQSYENATKGWDTKEIRDFHDWVRFYEEQGHMKYTTAQMYGYEGYYLPTTKPTIPNPVVQPTEVEQLAAIDNQAALDHQAAMDQQAAEAAQIESAKKKKEELLEHRKKILSRLQAARKLFTHDQGKQLAGENLNTFLDMLNELEKQIHGLQANAFTINALIKRQATILRHAGATRSADVMYSFADNLPGGLPPEDPNASTTQGGAIGNNNPTDLMQPSPAGDSVGAGKANPALIQFLNGLNGEDPFEDNTDADDNSFEDDDDVEIDDQEDELSVEDHEGILISKAQAAEEPIAEPEALAPPPEAKTNDPAKSGDIEVEPGAEIENKDLNEDGLPSKDFDSLIDAAFSNLKVGDIVKRLDDLSRIFKNREIARQLSIVDMMMDKLGLSSFFPSLAEATRSALESNQYCLVRIDEVKDRLAGAMNTVGKSTHDSDGEPVDLQEGGVDLMGTDNSPDDPLLNELKTTLDSQTKKDKLKKDLRKTVEDKALINAGNKQKAEVEDISNELDKENARAADIDGPKPGIIPGANVQQPLPASPTAAVKPVA